MNAPHDIEVRKAYSSTDRSLLNKMIRFCLNYRLVVLLLFVILIFAGICVAPFDWKLDNILPRNPVPVDAIPDIGENQQIVFTEWPGRSPQDIEDQITYPLSVELLGLPGVKTVRSISMFGFSTIYVIFRENVDFYWSRTRILEKLNSLDSGSLPSDVSPQLGPDATALGQVYWYTLEGLDQKGKPTGGWDQEELRAVQDWQVKYALLGVDGVSEVASVGGFVKEYLVEVNPDAMRTYGVTLTQVYNAVKDANTDIGARTIEINNVEYVIRGLGYIKKISDIENSVIKSTDNVPIYVKNVAKVSLGPAQRRGLLDKEGTEAVGGVVIVRYGENPLKVINAVKRKIAEFSSSLPEKRLANGTISRVSIVPFYDRTGLIHETLDTLNMALIEEILITIIVILVMIRNFKIAGLISGILPGAVLMAFVMMKVFKVDANIVALSGIAIAIGTIVDMGIVVSENIVNHLERSTEKEDRLFVIYKAMSEISGAVVTAVATTVVSFLPVFSLQEAEGKLFRPLAFTKTFTLIAALLLALTVIPVIASFILKRKKVNRRVFFIALIAAGIIMAFYMPRAGAVLIIWGCCGLIGPLFSVKFRRYALITLYAAAIVFMLYILAAYWLPLGPDRGIPANMLLVAVPVVFLLGIYYLFQRYYTQILGWCLTHKYVFLCLPLVVLLFGLLSWRGIKPITSRLPQQVQKSAFVSGLNQIFPGLGYEFMPALDEGAFLYMPTVMPHAGIGAVQKILRQQDMAIRAIPEVESVVGKAGRADTSLDPAPLSMIETVINYKLEYLKYSDGRLIRFKFDPTQNDFFRAVNGTPLNAPDGEPYFVNGKFIRDSANKLIPDSNGKVFRLWRPELMPKLNPGRNYWHGIRTPDDIWNRITAVADVPGSTSAPKLQPIETRIVMLQSGMKAPMGVKITGRSIADIEQASLTLEKALKNVDALIPATVTADRTVGKPYLEIEINRQAIARYGIKLADVQNVIQTAIGGGKATTTVEGRERYAVRVRYQRELRDSLESLKKILVASPTGAQIPLKQLATIRYVRGPQSIKSENTFLTGYVFFDRKPGIAEVEAVERASVYLSNAIQKGEIKLPTGISYTFAGSFENQLRAQKRLSVIIPLALALVFVILILQFHSTITSLLVFSGIAVAWAGGFILLWFYNQSWFMDFSIFGLNLQELLQIGPVNLSVAVWVGFLALFGIATDDGVVMATYIRDCLKNKQLKSRNALQHTIISAGQRRIRPCLMTTATTVLALIPVLMSTGRGSDIMMPMAVPIFGGMLIELITMLIVPVLYYTVEVIKINKALKQR